MNLKELDSFRISDAISFHDKLNPKLWNNNKLRPEVKQQLLIIAEDFLEELGINGLDVADMTVSGSNAAYSYTPNSDLDLHILVDMSKLPNNEVYRELFTAKKSLYNDSHDIKIHGIPVELYVQDAREPVVSLGEYSLKNDNWLKIPSKRRANFDQTATKTKYEKLLTLIELALKSRKYSKVSNIIKTIKRYRQSGLDKGGEFGPENLAYKALRAQGYITKLYDLRDKLHSEKLTIETMYQPIKDDVNEAFDQPYRLRWEHGDYGDVDAIAKMDDGNYLSIMFNKGFSQGTKEEAWSVEFFRNYSQEVTGEGDAQRVFATVLSAIQKFIKKYKPNRVIFSASKEVEQGQNAQSRARLYDSLVQRYARAWGFKAFRADTGNKVIYELSRIKPITKPVKEDTENYNGIVISLDKEDDEIMVKAMTANGREMGHVLFVQEGDYLMPQDLEVEERYQGQGIAATMYDYVKSKGYKIRRSGQQTDAGAGFWDKHRPQQNVWEDDTMQYASEKTSAVNPYGGLEDNQYRGSISEDFSNDMSTEDMIEYLRQHHDKNLHPDYVNHLTSTNSKFILKNIPLTSIRTDLSGLDKSKVEQYKQMNFSKAPPIVVGSDGNILDGYHRANVAKALNIPSIKAYVGVKNQQMSEASGYIPSEKEKNDPRFKTALTVDVHPDSIKKNAKAFGWLTSRAGIPPTARANGKI